MSHSCRVDSPEPLGSHWKSAKLRCNMTQHEIGALVCVDCPQSIENLWILIGWGTWIRTRTNGVRVRWSTVNLFPKVAVGRCPSRRCGGLINKSAANANTFWQKNAISMWRRDFCTDLPVPTVRRGAAHLRPGGGAGHDCEGVQIAIAVRSVDRIRPYPLAAQSKTVWRTGLALVQSRQRKIERAP